MSNPLNIFSIWISYGYSGIYTAPRRPHTRPQPRKNLPKPGSRQSTPDPQKSFYVQEVYKMASILETGEKLVKNQFSIEIFECKFWKFVEISNLNLLFPQTRKMSRRVSYGILELLKIFKIRIYLP